MHFYEEFEKQILNPVLKNTKSVADTSELFSRATKMLDIFNCFKDSIDVVNTDNIIITKVDQDDVITDQKSTSNDIDLEILSYSELLKKLDNSSLKIGEFAKAIFNKIIEYQ
jgi:hypothetical protein